MKEVTNRLLTNKYTRVFHEDEFTNNAPHHFKVYESTRTPEPKLLGQVDFQEGPIKESGVNGVCNEDLIAMVICRLDSFQRSPYKCAENAMAIDKLEEALICLRRRTVDRENRGVEGTHIV